MNACAVYVLALYVRAVYVLARSRSAVGRSPGVVA